MDGGWVGIQLIQGGVGWSLFSIWRFLNILMEIQLPSDSIALLGIFTRDWTFDVTFCLNKHGHMVNSCLVSSKIVCLGFVKTCQTVDSDDTLKALRI